ncbi:MAG: bi-domain-containing oxidoreductase [Gammaproteobacteria bacterium]|nr:bi-domain-containing oxidoreductase [Gammaproteobacteria bacterium]MBQ0840675.1 bi-domain-containing oxidoreductase [Gammaproteobacteria bacterium]
MKQVLQDLSAGKTLVAEVPSPKVRKGHLLIETRLTLVSAGTEKMLVDFGRGNLVQKAMQQPEKVKQVLDKVATDGLLATYDSVRRKLAEPLALGYCNVGRVIEVGEGLDGFSPGDRVLSNGKHAGFVCVPKHLCALIPDEVEDEDAVFTVIGAIALQGMRLAAPNFGETFVVVGLGLVGLMAVQLLRANGCRVMGVDLDESRLAIARRLGAHAVVAASADVLAAAKEFSAGQGVDGVLITASTRSNEPVSQAAQMCRKRGRIVLVGVVGLELNRGDFYEKELSFQVSCSYGPGRYEEGYELRGEDYPIGFVRWTEQRNFKAVLESMATGVLNLAPLRSHRFKARQAEEAYEVLATGQSIGIVLEFIAEDGSELGRVGLCPGDDLHTINFDSKPSTTVANTPQLGFLGSGNYARGVLIPAFSKTAANLVAVTSADGLSAAQAAQAFNIKSASTDNETVLANDAIDTLVISTRHDSHASLVCKALQAGKHVFVEKPLAMDLQGLQNVQQAYHGAVAKGGSPQLMVGFNRRFSPLSLKIRDLLASTQGPKAMVMTINSGAIPANHWSQSKAQGGGRIIGEACHFIDLLRYFADAPITSVKAAGLPDSGLECTDTATINLTFADGSLGTLHYFSNGDRRLAKERLEIFVGGRVIQLDNFKRIKAYGWPGFKAMRLYRQDKGQQACAAAFIDCVSRGVIDSDSAIPSVEELWEVAGATINAAKQLDEGSH